MQNAKLRIKNFKLRKLFIYLVIASLLLAISFHHTAHAAAVPEGFSKIVKENSLAVVNINTTQIIRERIIPFPPFPRELFPDREFRRQSLGSGFIINKEGYILTNNHVIEKAEDIRITLWDETEHVARVIGKDRRTDIAIIKIDAGRPLPTVTLGNSDALDVGDWVIAIGNPFGLGHTVTAGIVSAKGRVIGAGPYDDFIQTDTAINPGSSGGPLFNIKGEVVGINSAIIPMAQNIGFALPINIAREILSSLKEKGKVERGWLGITIQKITPEIAESFNLPDRSGALVTVVAKDSPADKAGIKRGDVIIELSGKKIKEMHEVPRLIANTPVGKSASIKVLREGKVLELTAIVGLLKEDLEVAEALILNRLGIKARTIGPELAHQFGIRDGGAILITDIDGRSPAFMAGLRKGDAILEANRIRVHSVDDLAEVLKPLKENSSFVVFVKRGAETIYFSFRIRK